MNSALRSLIWFSFPIWIIGTDCQAQSLQVVEHDRINLPNGWHLTPVGRSVQVGDFPLNLAVSHDGTRVAVTNNGEGDQSIELIDAGSLRILDSVAIPQSWLGLQFTRDNRYLYASEGNRNAVMIYAAGGNRLKLYDSISLGDPWPERISPTGLALDESRNRLYVVTKENNSLYAVDLRTKRVLFRQVLDAEAYTCILSPSGGELYISCWGGDHVIVFDTRRDWITTRIPAGNHPNDLCLTRDGKYLFVANSQDNSVSVIDAARCEVLETLDAAMYPGSLEGSTSNSIALGQNDHILYVANADNNCLAVFDVEHPGHSSSKGFIPTGWYPTCVRVVRDQVWVANGKGFTSFPNPLGPNPMKRSPKGGNPQYIARLLRGSVSIIPPPDARQLGIYSEAVYHNSPYSLAGSSAAAPPDPVPTLPGGSSAIQHVFYVVKENRTYDQVLGDDPRGNGDTSLCLFPERVTPNEHAIVREFVLLDNFYVDGEVSADGHNWSMAAYANDYIEKTWPTQYGGRGGEYDYIANRSISLPRNGFIWDNCHTHHVTFRNYGEFADDGVPHPKTLAGYTCRDYPGWDLKIHDTTRERIWEHDFDSLVAAGSLPAMNIVYFPNDHTSGLARGAFTPLAAVADNDLALGRFLEHLSLSPVWKTSAVFVLEDDAQDGPDHVDAHRSTAYVAGGYVRRHAVDHTMYSSSSMLRTMELILGLPPMSQYDAAAVPMWRCFDSIPDTSPYHARPAAINLGERNVAMNNLMKESERFDLTRADNVPCQDLNRVLWQALRGEGSVMPPARRGAFLSTPVDD